MNVSRTESFTTRSGIRIHYTVEGSGPPLVLLHGLGTSSDLWRIGGYVDALANDRQLVLVDARGHGRSQTPAEVDDYQMANHVADVMAVVDELELPAASYVGFSLGGETALLLAAMHPDRTIGVATIGAQPAGSEFTDVPGHDPAGAIEQAMLFEAQGMTWLVDILESEGRPRWAALMKQSDGNTMALQCRAWAAPGAVRGRLSAIRAPVLMIWGEHEKPEPMPPLPPTARVMIIPGADHAGALEAVGRVARAVRDFLEGPPSTT